jgi:hypothetical protein
MSDRRARSDTRGAFRVLGRVILRLVKSQLRGNDLLNMQGLEIQRLHEKVDRVLLILEHPVFVGWDKGVSDNGLQVGDITWVDSSPPRILAANLRMPTTPIADPEIPAGWPEAVYTETPP